VLDGVEFMNGMDGILTVGEAIMRKASKRAESDWQLPASSILVLSTPDCPISEIVYHFDAQLQTEFVESGFTEIWIADHTAVDAYGDIELFGLVPKRWWGYHPNLWRGKPHA
jgi:hypothetical protein